MSFARVLTRAAVGVEAPEVWVEVHLGSGLPSLAIVGLPEAAVREARDRVRAAILNAALDFPESRVTVSLAPADLPKSGSGFDLAIAIGILAASRQLRDRRLPRTEFIAELSLAGELRAVPGVLPAAIRARARGRTLVVAPASGAEATLVRGVDAGCPGTLLDTVAWLNGQAELPAPVAPPVVEPRHAELGDVIGQDRARRALEVAAAGQHHLLMRGPPGTGKTMLASRLPGILPPMTEDEALETAAIGSVCGAGFDPGRWRQRPFRAPHHSASGPALVGGGSVPRPGEISLAHNGVLFLDELPEFKRGALEVLREPLESGRIVISRAARQAEFPARFQLVAAMNPCPCGYLGDPAGRCRCSGEAIARYLARVSGPLLDRIDLQVEVPRPPDGCLARPDPPPEDSATVRERVIAARRRQHERQGRPNALLDSASLDTACALDADGEALLRRAARRWYLSPRAVHRVLKVARTIADLGGGDGITPVHLAEAIAYRQPDGADRPAPPGAGRSGPSGLAIGLS